MNSLDDEDFQTPKQVAFWAEVVLDVTVLGLLTYMFWKGSY